MSRERKIINTNIRLNLMEPADREAWEHLQHMDRKKYKSYSRAVVAALNDYFRRKNSLAADPYLETREKEDRFLQKVLDTIDAGARQSMPMVVMNSLMTLLQPAVMRISSLPITSDPIDPNVICSGEKSAQQVTTDIEAEESLDDALDFADSF